jgi:hypothetical protein
MNGWDVNGCFHTRNAQNTSAALKGTAFWLYPREIGRAGNQGHAKPTELVVCKSNTCSLTGRSSSPRELVKPWVRFTFGITGVLTDLPAGTRKGGLKV